MKDLVEQKDEDNQQVKLYNFRTVGFLQNKFPPHCTQHDEVREMEPCSKCGREITISLYYKTLIPKQGTTWPDILNVGNGIVVSQRVFDALQEINATGYTTYEIESIEPKSKRLQQIEPPKYIGLKVVSGGISHDVKLSIAAPMMDLENKKPICEHLEYCSSCLRPLDQKNEIGLSVSLFMPNMLTWSGEDFVGYCAMVLVSKKVARMFLQKKFTNVFLQHGDCINDYELPKRIKRIGDL